MKEIIEKRLGQLRQQLPQQQLQVYKIQLEINRLEAQIASLKGQLTAYRTDFNVAMDAIKITEVGIMTCEALLEEWRKADEEVEEHG